MSRIRAAVSLHPMPGTWALSGPGAGHWPLVAPCGPSETVTVALARLALAGRSNQSDVMCVGQRSTHCRIRFLLPSLPDVSQYDGFNCDRSVV